MSPASNTTPIQITTSAANEYITGQVVKIDGVGGNTNANDTWIITVKTSTTFLLNGSEATQITRPAAPFHYDITTAAAQGLV